MPDGETHTVRVGSETHILDAALASGLALPFRCLRGWCLTCAARLEKGSVDQSDSLRYYQVDREAGFTLLCTARACSDLVVRTHASQDMKQHREKHDLPYPKGKWGQGLKNVD